MYVLWTLKGVRATVVRVVHQLSIRRDIVTIINS